MQALCLLVDSRFAELTRATNESARIPLTQFPCHPPSRLFDKSFGQRNKGILLPVTCSGLNCSSASTHKRRCPNWPGSTHFDAPGSHFGVPGSYFGVSGSYFGVSGSYFGVSGSHFGVSGSHFGVPGSHFGVPGSHFSVSGSHFGVPGSHFGVVGSHFDVSGSHFDVPGSHFGVPGSHFDVPVQVASMSGRRYRHQAACIADWIHVRPWLLSVSVCG